MSEQSPAQPSPKPQTPAPGPPPTPQIVISVEIKEGGRGTEQKAADARDK
jgi:hypothetical protein